MFVLFLYRGIVFFYVIGYIFLLLFIYNLFVTKQFSKINTIFQLSYL